MKAYISFYFFKDFIYFLERGERREKEREKNTDVWNIHWLPLTHPKPRTWPTTEACAQTGNQTSHVLVRGLAFNLLNHTSQGYVLFMCTWRLHTWNMNGNIIVNLGTSILYGALINLMHQLWRSLLQKTKFSIYQDCEQIQYVRSIKQWLS